MDTSRTVFEVTPQQLGARSWLEFSRKVNFLALKQTGIPFFAHGAPDYTCVASVASGKHEPPISLSAIEIVKVKVNPTDLAVQVLAELGEMLPSPDELSSLRSVVHSSQFMVRKDQFTSIVEFLSYLQDGFR
jgi:hypothetical protein